MNKVIGVMPLWDDEKNSIWMLPGYMEGIKQAGGLPFIFPDSLAVNSYHHQAVKELAPGLKQMAVSSDSLTEALYMPGRKFLWAVQWHPEFSFRNDENSQRIFSAFIDSILK